MFWDFIVLCGFISLPTAESKLFVLHFPLVFLLVSDLAMLLHRVTAAIRHCHQHHRDTADLRLGPRHPATRHAAHPLQDGGTMGLLNVGTDRHGGACVSSVEPLLPACMPWHVSDTSLLGVGRLPPIPRLVSTDDLRCFVPVA